MKPVFQQIVDKDSGDCFRACLASILELDCEDVPNFRAMVNESGADMMDFAREWCLKNYNISLVSIFMNKIPDCGDDFRLTGGCEGTPLIASYESPNLEGCTHAVVGEIDKHGLNITITHDPNPNGKPIESYPRFITLLVPLNPLFQKELVQ